MSINIIGGSDGDDLLKGTSKDDLIYGYDGHDHLNGKGGTDTLYGGKGDDYYYYYTDNLDTAVENPGEGTDTLFSMFNTILPANIEHLTLFGAAIIGTGNDSNNTIVGDAGANILDGKGGKDIIHGEQDNDTINGGHGADTLYGEGGADTFVFDSTAYDGRDRIRDFSLAGGDRIELRGLLSGYVAGTSKITDFVRITQNAAGDSYLYVDATGAAGWANFVQIARIDAATGLTDEKALLTSGNLIVSYPAI